LGFLIRVVGEKVGIDEGDTNVGGETLGRADGFSGASETMIDGCALGTADASNEGAAEFEGIALGLDDDARNEVGEGDLLGLGLRLGLGDVEALAVLEGEALAVGELVVGEALGLLEGEALVVGELVGEVLALVEGEALVVGEIVGAALA
jgi:hypothetical protein